MSCSATKNSGLWYWVKRQKLLAISVQNPLLTILLKTFLATKLIQLVKIAMMSLIMMTKTQNLISIQTTALPSPRTRPPHTRPHTECTPVRPWTWSPTPRQRTRPSWLPCLLDLLHLPSISHLELAVASLHQHHLQPLQVLQAFLPRENHLFKARMKV